MILAVLVSSFALAQSVDILPARATEGASGLVADFDGDGLLDRLATDFETNTVTLFLGDGFGGFVQRNTLSFAVGHFLSAPIDVDGDGAFEAMVQTCCSPSQLMLIRVGPSGVATITTNAPLLYAPYYLQPGDFTGDGVVDLLGITNDNYVVLVGNGLGAFTVGPVSAKDLTVRSLTHVGDLDGDGDLDAAGGRFEGVAPGGIAVAVNLGTGALTDTVRPTSLIGLEQAPRALADFDQDGRLDLVVGSLDSTNEQIVLLRNVSTPTSGPTFAEFSAMSPAALVPGATLGRFVDAGVFDVDHDGRPEFATSVWSNAGHRLVFLSSAATPTGFAVLASQPSFDPSPGALVDFDLDGAADLITDRGSLHALVRMDVLNADPDLTFDAAAVPNSPVVAPLDLDADGDLDLVMGSASGNALALATNTAGAFGPATAFALLPSASARILTADADLDGDLDVFVRSWFDVTRFDDVGGTLVQRTSITATIQPGFGFLADRMALGDLDHDGRLDAAICANSGMGVTILRGTPAGFSLGATLPLPLAFRDVAIDDVNGDGWLDVVATSMTHPVTNAFVTVFTGGPGGSLALASSTALGVSAVGLALGDFDDDGLVDAAVASPHTRTIQVLRGQGSSFSLHDTLPLTQSNGDLTRLRAVDVDFDGWLDLVALATTQQVLAVFSGRYDGSFTPRGTFACMGSDFAVMDVDADGHLDVVSAGDSVELAIARAQDGAAGIEIYGAGKPGTHGEPTLGVLGAPILGAPFGLRIQSGLAGAVPVLFIGSQRVALAFDGGTLNVLPQLTLVLPPLDLAGRIALPLSLPSVPAFAGIVLDAQAVFVDPGAGGFLQTAQTKGLEMSFGT
ncbi:MAG: VCBS repeat-containing protein [Planctomycetes bacterium]|nr:VCBS repeat-containing protein [Planctomycetota bacterium]MCC7170820.1 VCBS repeat-containing protein [Planctomycetota bacterium]